MNKKLEKEIIEAMKSEVAADSPTSVLEDEPGMEGEDIISKGVSEVEGKDEGHKNGRIHKRNESLEENVHSPFELEAKNGDSSLISEMMAEEEEHLLEARVKAEQERNTKFEPHGLPDKATQLSKLDALLTQTQLYSKFLLDKMDDTTFDSSENQAVATTEKKGGRGTKRKAAVKYNERKAKTAVAAMLSRSEKNQNPEDAALTEEEIAEKEQAAVVPLMTGGKLKPYQVKGVKWIISLWQNGLNGILADQMGLGKTIQTIGFLAHLKGKGLHGPYLIIAPLSTLSNWANEIARFVPSMHAIIYHGSKQDRQEIRRKYMPRSTGPKFPVIITSFEIAMNDAKVLSAYKWKYVVVDEGHRLKNTNCLLLRELRRLPIENKLLLTGTPLQNNLAELWSLLNFILPDIFSSYQEFESWFDFSEKFSNESNEEASDEKRRLEVVSKLHCILRPFLLRRVKDDVEKMLPQKKEIILYACMTDHQKELQDHLVNKTFENFLEKKGDEVIRKPGMKGKLNNLVMQLRKICNHPDFLDSLYDGTSFYPPIKELVEQCGKFRLLDRLLTLLLSQNHKVLLFSQFTMVLDIIEYFLSEKGVDVCRIDGSVKLDDRKRQESIRGSHMTEVTFLAIVEFNDMNSKANVFLLSTRAGGLGINLTAADTCILYDSDWNPQMDLQAMDRCHRIGQTRPVHVYRLATAHSVEGRMLKRAFNKLKLEHVVIGKGHFEHESSKANALDESELLTLLRNQEDEDDKFVQTDISDEDLLRVLDRSDLIRGKIESDGSESKNHPTVTSPLPLRGPGWEVVVPVKSGGGMLSAVDS